MSLRKLPQIQNFALPEGVEPAISEQALERYRPALRVKNAAIAGAAVIEIYGEIGKDPWTGEGIDASDVAAQLKGQGDVVVNINSPGGLFFEGTAIYNLLASHQGKVTTQNIGLAGSAASLIFMAGDERLMAPAAFVMIHNAWNICMGDRHDMTAAAETLGSIDGAIRDLYVAATGKHANSIATMMDDESWLNSKDAIAQNFATGRIVGSISEAPEAKAMAHPQAARMRAEAIFQQHGLSRSKRRELLAELKCGPAPQNLNSPAMGDIAEDLRAMQARLNGQPSATDPAKPRAGFSAAAAKLLEVLET